MSKIIIRQRPIIICRGEPKIGEVIADVGHRVCLIRQTRVERWCEISFVIYPVQSRSRRTIRASEQRPFRQRRPVSSNAPKQWSILVCQPRQDVISGSDEIQQADSAIKTNTHLRIEFERKQWNRRVASFQRPHFMPLGPQFVHQQAQNAAYCGSQSCGHEITPWQQSKNPRGHCAIAGFRVKW